MKKKHIVIAIAAALSLAGGYHVLKQTTPSAPPVVRTNNKVVQSSKKSGPAFLYPDAVQTPGTPNTNINQGNISQNICNPNWSTKSIRPPVSYTNQLKHSEIAAGYTYQGDTNLADYELDHFISLELGGDPSSQSNLWPEPYHTQVNGVEVGAHQKDKVENYLHKQVCAGAITLTEAQREITEDWYQVFVNNHL